MSNWIIIGSTAMHHWYPGMVRPPKDIDLLTPAKISGNVIDTCIVDASWHDAAQAVIDASADKVFLDPNLLLTLKVSHAQWDIKWNKTMFDIDFLYARGLTVNEEVWKKLFDVWKVIHGKKRVNMTKKVPEFFTDAVKRTYDHEYLHELVAFYDRPLHEMLRPDLETVWCSPERFYELSFDDQCRTVLEEMMATAIERGQLTISSTRIDRIKAMNYAYFKLVTSMTTGWFARFLIQHQRYLLSTRKPEWETKLQGALSHIPAMTS